MPKPRMLNGRAVTDAEVLIRCGICDGKRQWFSACKPTRNVGKRMLWNAVERGDYIETSPLTPEAMAYPACSCSREATS